MEVNSEIIRLIKEKFVTQQRAVKSVKQLDFFMKRAKTEGDKFTNLKFNQFLENYDLEVHFDRAVHNLSSLSKSDLTVTKNKLSLIQDNNTSPKSHTVLNQVLTMYEKYMDGFDDGDKYQFETPWLTNIVYSTPKNIKTGLPYRGGNEFLLELIQQERTLDLPIYLNEHNIEEIGETPPSNPIAVCQKVIDVYLNPKLENDHPKKWVSATEYRKLTSNEQDDYVNKKSLKLFNLYHHSQYADSLTSNSKYQKWLSNFQETKLLNKLKSCGSADERKKIFEPKVFAATAFIDSARKQMKIKLKSDPNSCHYTPATDEIAMVDVGNFKGEFAELLYAGVYAHENSHATGHKKRLDRKLSFKDGKAYKNAKAYAFEEVVAESSSQQIMKKFNLSSIVEKQSAKYIHGWLQGQSDNSNRDFLQIGCNKGKQASDFIALKALEYQDNLISSLDINEMLERLENASNNQLDADSLFVAEYINTLSIKALNKFLKAEFDEFTELELLEVTGRLLSRSESQMKLIDNFDLYLKEHYKISIFNAKKSGEISEQYGLTTFFDNKVDYSFTEQKVLSAFHQQFGKEKIKDYIKVLEMDNLEFKSDKKTIDELCNFTDKSFLFKAFVEAQYDSLKI